MGVIIYKRLNWASQTNLLTYKLSKTCGTRQARIMVSKRVFYLPEFIICLIRNHQVMHEIPPGDAECPLRHLWLRAWYCVCN